MGLVGKKQTAGRFLGWIIITLGMILTFIFDFIIISIIYNIFDALGVPIWYICIILLAKMDRIRFLESHKKEFYIITFTIIFLLTFILGYYVGSDKLFLIISGMTIIVLWHMTLSIEKKEKRGMVIVYILYLSSGFIIRLIFIEIQFLMLFLIPMIIISIGVAINLLSEWSMRKKGLMKYI